MTECGTCSLCCKLLGVQDDDFNKPVGEWCQFCKPGNGGCTIYSTRPRRCRDFECGWVANDGQDDMRPDRIHMIVTGESREVGAYIAHVDPKYPDAPQRPKGQLLLHALVNHGHHPNVILVTGDKRTFLGNDSRKLEAKLAAYEAAGKFGDLK